MTVARLIYISLIIVLFSGLSGCKKEYSCEGCADNNKPPLANAGPDQVIILPTNNVLLDGSGSSDPDGTVTGFLWAKISGPASLTLRAPTLAQTTGESLVQGVYLFELKITDNAGLSDTDTVQITVSNPASSNRPPIANAGPDQIIILPNNSINLKGSSSTDPDNNISSYLWAKISGPFSSNINNQNTAQTQVTNLIEGIYQFELKVTDAGGLFDLDTMQVLVNPASTIPPITDCFIPNSEPVGSLSIARTEMAAAICNNKILVAGGGYYNVFSAIDIFDPISNTITSANLSIARYGIGSIGIGNKAFFAGGFASQGWLDPVSRVDIYDASANTWSTAELSIPRAYMAVGVLGNKVFFAGGLTGPASSNVTSRIDIYDLSTGQWTIAELSEARGDFAAAVVGNKILFAGGRTSNASSSRVDIYDVSTNTWSVANLSSPLIGLTSIVLNNKAYFTGSNFGLAQSVVEVYDLQTNSWSTLQLSEGKVWIPVGTSNNKIAFIGGMLGWFKHSTKIEIYDPATNTFSYSYMNKDLMFESIVSYNNFIYSFGGSINDGDIAISSICKFRL